MRSLKNGMCLRPKGHDPLAPSPPLVISPACPLLPHGIFHPMAPICPPRSAAPPGPSRSQPPLPIAPTPPSDRLPCAVLPACPAPWHSHELRPLPRSSPSLVISLNGARPLPGATFPQVPPSPRGTQINRPIDQPTAHLPTDPPAENVANPPTTQPASAPANQPANQPAVETSQPTPKKQTIQPDRQR